MGVRGVETFVDAEAEVVLVFVFVFDDIEDD